MNIVTPHETAMVRKSVMTLFGCADLTAQGWLNDDLTDQERRNLALVDRFWKVWKTLPFDGEALRDCFHPDVSVRTGWRGEGVVKGRDAALEMYSEEINRQNEHGENTDFRFPVVVAKGPIVFHTWVWISWSEKLGYHLERPMASSYLITDNWIERWDSYCTGPESAPGYVGGAGPDGL